jgi:hypothetical protein
MLAFHDSIQEMERSGRWNLPLPGSGETPRRLLMLSQIARRDLCAGRIAEGHTDAIAILAEAGVPARKDTLYGVWTADDPSEPVRAERLPDLGWRLQGMKRWCCGAPLVRAALVTAQTDDGLLLFDVAMDDRVQPQPSEWQTPALAEAQISPVRFNEVVPTHDDSLGAPDWYLRRPGFWNGAIGAAAVWAGGAMSLIDAARDMQPTSRGAREQMEALEAIAWQLGAILDQCGREIDEEPADLTGRSRTRALMVRHLVERSCTEVMERFGRATGDHFLAHDAFIANQFSALNLCIRQARIDREIETPEAAKLS